MKVYRVKDWTKHYENNRTSEMKVMRWVPFPNTHDGDGYTLLVNGSEGAAMLGAWVACVQVASKCDPRGTLLRGGGRPHDAGSISRITRLSEKVIEAMLVRASHPDIAWLEVIEIDEVTGEVISSPQEPAENPQLHADTGGGAYSYSIPFYSFRSFRSQGRKKTKTARHDHTSTHRGRDRAWRSNGACGG